MALLPVPTDMIGKMLLCSHKEIPSSALLHLVMEATTTLAMSLLWKILTR